MENLKRTGEEQKQKNRQADDYCLPDNPDLLVNTGDLAKFLGIEDNTVAVWRHKGRGPQYIKVGSTVRYRVGDVHDWLNTQTVRP